MKDYKFTIFTPCYNGEKTIGRVFKSVANQTYKNFEWIIVNDGSKDKSKDIINELRKTYQEIDEKIIYLEQKNMGKHMAWFCFRRYRSSFGRCRRVFDDQYPGNDRDCPREGNSRGTCRGSCL